MGEDAFEVIDVESVHDVLYYRCQVLTVRDRIGSETSLNLREDELNRRPLRKIRRGKDCHNTRQLENCCDHLTFVYAAIISHQYKVLTSHVLLELEDVVGIHCCGTATADKPTEESAGGIDAE